MQNAPTILGVLTHQSQKKDYMFTRLYRHVFNPDFFRYAQEQRYFRRSGGLWPKELCLEESVFTDQVALTIEQLRQERYDFKRPTTGEGRDEEAYMYSLIADSVAYILHAVHGSRWPEPPSEPGSLLKDVCASLEGKISQVYQHCGSDPLEGQHGWRNTLMPWLSTRIKDGRFLKLLDALVQAGYGSHWMHDGTFSRESIGSPLSEVCRKMAMAAIEREARSRLTGKDHRLFGYGSTMVLVVGKNQEVAGFSSPKPNREGTLPLWGYSIQPQSNRWVLRVDHERQSELLKPFNNEGRGRARGWLMGTDIPTLLSIYRAELHSWQRYFYFARNYPAQLHRFVYYHRSSLLATVAQKLDLSYQQAKSKCMDPQTPGGVCWLDPNGQQHRYGLIQRPRLRGSRSPKTFPWDGRGMADIDILPPTWTHAT